MKGSLSAALLASALATQQVVATGFGSWGGAKQFTTPDNCDNVCTTDQQKGGFNWGDLKTGKVDSYGGFGFAGFTCADGLGKRTGKGSDKSAKGSSGDSQKCIKGSITKGSQGGPSFSKQKGQNDEKDQKDSDQFSIKNIHVSTSYETDVDCHYKMPDNSICKQTISCGKSPKPFENSQCGGATEVSFQIPDYGQDKGCEIGIHSIDFDCSPPKTTNKPTSAPSKTPPTPPSVSIPLTTGNSSPPSPPSGTPSTPPVSPPVGNTTYSMPTGGSAPIPPISTPPSSVPMTVSTIYTTITSTTVSCSKSVKNCPAESTSTVTSTSVVGVTTCPVSQTGGTSELPTSTPPVVTPPSTPSTPTVPTPAPSGSVVTVTTYTTETTCPVTNTITTGGSTTTSIGSTVSTTVITTTITTCTACAGGQPSISTGVSPAPSGSPPGPAPCPSLLPSCLNTFIPYLTTCLSNSDHSCFCPDSKLTGSVMDCIKSWGASQDEVTAAYSFFAGVCAAAVPSNPGIVTAVPPTITLSVPGPSAAPPAAGTSAPPAGAAPPAPNPLPATTISYTQTVTTGGSTTTVTNAATVPQVSFTTNTPAAPTGGAPAAGTTTQSVGLVPAPAPTGAAGAGAGAGAPGASSPLSPTSGAGNNGTTQSTPSPSPSPSAFLGAAGRVSTGSTGFFVAVLAGMAALLL